MRHFVNLTHLRYRQYYHIQFAQFATPVPLALCGPSSYSKSSTVATKYILSTSPRHLVYLPHIPFFVPTLSVSFTLRELISPSAQSCRIDYMFHPCSPTSSCATKLSYAPLHSSTCSCTPPWKAALFFMRLYAAVCRGATPRVFSCLCKLSSAFAFLLSVHVCHTFFGVLNCSWRMKHLTYTKWHRAHVSVNTKQIME